ncbi:hypothetical protein [Herbaspirillum sp. ST 5-3]|nr:hypothetical protein [Herbaspirillum sp. ST 5-3]
MRIEILAVWLLWKADGRAIGLLYRDAWGLLKEFDVPGETQGG